jgi:hypothetical protein
MIISKRNTLIVIFSLLIFSKSSYGSVNGGGNCLACTVIVSTIEQLTVINEISVENALVKFCNFFTPGYFQTYCQNLILVYGSAIINA